MAMPVLTVSSKNYSSWALRGWLLCKMSGLKFEERKASVDDASMRAELLLLSPSCLVPCLEHMGTKIWDTFAIAEYLKEIKPKAGLYPAARSARAHCRAVSGEMHSGFFNLRSALPMNLKARHPGFKVFAGAQPDIALIPLLEPAHAQSVGLVSTDRDPPPPMARALEACAERLYFHDQGSGIPGAV